MHGNPANDGTSHGTFSLRLPARPNPIGTSIAKLVSIEGAIVTVRGLDCLDWDTATRSQAGSYPVHADRPASTGGFPGRRILRGGENQIGGFALTQAKSRGFWTLPALDDIDNNGLPFVEPLDARPLKGRDVDKHVLSAAIRSNET